MNSPPQGMIQIMTHASHTNHASSLCCSVCHRTTHNRHKTTQTMTIVLPQPFLFEVSGSTVLFEVSRSTVRGSVPPSSHVGSPPSSHVESAGHRVHLGLLGGHAGWGRVRGYDLGQCALPLHEVAWAPVAQSLGRLCADLQVGGV